MAQPTGDKLTSDFRAQPNQAQRAVSKGTMLQIAGERMFQSGLGAISSAAMTSQADKAATRATYNQIGEENAEAIRNRFYQKEMASVKKMRIDPLLQEIDLAKDEHSAITALKVRPVRTIKSSNDPEALMKEAQLQQLTATPTPPQAMTTGKGENAKTEIMPGTPQQQPNRITSGETDGMVSISEDGLTVLDPETGLAVHATTPEGQAILSRANGKFWDKYAQVNTQLMDIFSEYAGNPFMDSAMRNLAQETMNQAGFGVTGQKSPEDQAAAYQRTKDDELSRTAQREEVLALRRGRAKDTGRIGAGAKFAKQYGYATPGATPEQQSSEYDLGTEREAITAAARKRRLNDGNMHFSADAMREPELLFKSELAAKDPKGRFQKLIDANLTTDIEELEIDLGQTAESKKAFAEKHGLQDNAAEIIRTLPTDNNQVQNVLVMLARMGAGADLASANALVQRLEEMSLQDVEVGELIGDKLNRLRRSGEWNNSMEEMYHTNPSLLWVIINNPHLRGPDGNSTVFFESAVAARKRKAYRARRGLGPRLRSGTPTKAAQPQRSKRGPLSSNERSVLYGESSVLKQGSPMNLSTGMAPKGYTSRPQPKPAPRVTHDPDTRFDPVKGEGVSSLSDEDRKLLSSIRQKITGS